MGLVKPRIKKKQTRNAYQKPGWGLKLGKTANEGKYLIPTAGKHPNMIAILPQQ